MDGKKLNGIFIVGASRSGTNLMRAILNLHSIINITGETHYFDDLRPKLKGKIQRPLAQQTITQVEKYFLSLGHRTYDHGGNPNESLFNVEDLRQIAHEEGGTADDYFYAYCKLDSGVTTTNIGERKHHDIFFAYLIYCRLIQILR